MCRMTNDKQAIDESFTVVTSRRKKRNKQTSNSQTTASSIWIPTEDLIVDEDSVIKRIKDAEHDLRVSNYHKNAISKLKTVLKDINEPIKIVCFGIGHFSDCSISRHQLAFILAVQSDLEISSITFHEPILSRSEVNILKKFNCCIVAENLEGKVEIESEATTIVYSLHCPKQLTNNLLWKNWNVNRLQRLLFIGNSFTNLLNSTPSRFLASDAAFIVKLQPHSEEIELENQFKFTDIFNDTSIHRFAKSALTALPSEFWSNDVSEPLYTQNVELITVDLLAKLHI